jgi:hypothetical protein
MLKVCKALNSNANNDAEITQFYAQKLQHLEGFGIIDLNFFSAYDEKLGFKFRIEEIRGIEETGFMM